MIDWFNWFFQFFGSFVSMLTDRFTIAGSVTLGHIIIAVLILSLLIRFFIGTWFSASFGSGSSLQKDQSDAGK